MKACLQAPPYPDAGQPVTPAQDSGSSCDCSDEFGTGATGQGGMTAEGGGNTRLLPSSGGGDSSGASGSSCDCGCTCSNGQNLNDDGQANVGGGGDTRLLPGLSSALQVLQATNRFAPKMVMNLGGGNPLVGYFGVDPASGGALIQFAPPSSGPFDPAIRFTHRSGSTLQTPVGKGWFHTYSRSLNQVSDTEAQITTSTGAVNVYGGGGGPLAPRAVAYMSPGNGVFNSFIGQTETRQDGLAYTYDPTGPLLLVQRNQVRVSLTYDGTKLNHALGHFGNRLSFSYDGANNLRRTQDGSGRITSYSVNGFGNLTQIIAPDGTRTSLAYESKSTRLKRWQNPLGDITSFSYDSFGLISQVHGPGGEQTSFNYNLPFNMVRVDPLNRRSTFTFDTLVNNLTGLVDATGKTTAWSFDNGALTSVTDGKGNTGSFRYTTMSDLVPRVLSVITPLGYRVSFIYDSTTFRLKSVINQLNRRTSIVWDANGNRIAVIEATGARTSYSFNSRSQLLSTTNPLGFRSSFVYDTQGRIGAHVNAIGARTSFAYDGNSQVRRVQNPLGYITTTLRDSFGRVLVRINPLGNRVSNSFDANGRLTQTITPLGFRTTFLHSNEDRPTASINPLGYRTSFGYDSTGNRIRLQNPLGSITTTRFDGLNRIIATINPVGYRTSYSYDGAGNQIALKNALGNRWTSIFDADSRATAHIDPLSHRASLAYDAASNLRRTMNGLGFSTTMEYDLLNRKRSAIDPLLNRSTSVFDAAGRSTAWINPLNNRWTIVFDAAGRSIARINPLNNRWTTILDAAAQPRATIDPLKNRISLVYDAAGQQINVTNPLGNRFTNFYDPMGRLVANVTPLQNRTTQVYDQASRNIATINPLSSRTTMTFDRVDRLVSTIDALLNRTTRIYDNANRQTAFINALTYRTSSMYDAADQPIVSINPLAKRTTETYDAASRVRRITNALGSTVTYLFDAADQQIALINPIGSRTSRTIDPAGRLIRTTNAVGGIRTNVYDPANQLISSINPLAYRTTILFDGAGRQIAIRDANNNRTTSLYDKADRAVATISALGYRASRVYDAASRLIAYVDANSNRSSFLYDSADRRVTLVDPLLRRTTAGYDAAGQQILRSDGRSFRTTYTIDLAGRTTKRRYPDGSRVTFAYDAIGNRILARTPNGSTTTTYDSMSQLSTVTNPPGLRLTYIWDAIGNRRRLTEPGGGIFTYAYNKDGTIAKLTNPQSRIATWSYDVAGRRITTRLGNGVRTTDSFDLADQLLRRTGTTSTGTLLSDLQYIYDPAGMRRRVLISHPLLPSSSIITWTYDRTYQLLAQSRNVTFVYDAVGNSVRRQSFNGQPLTLVYDRANQLLRQFGPTGGGPSYTSDLAGNLLSYSAGGTLTNVWDYESRLANSGGVTLSYDVDGLLVRSTNNQGGFSSDCRLIWDNQNLLSIVDTATNQSTILYTQEPLQFGSLVSMYERGNTFYHTFDAIGSVDTITDDLGSFYYQIFNPFGGLASGGGTSGFVFSHRLLWLGQIGYYQSGLVFPYYVRARHLDFGPGRFISPDPLGFDAGDTNLYRYAKNNPINQTDPSGLQVAMGLCNAQDDAGCMADCIKNVCMFPGPGFGKPAADTGKCGFVVLVNVNGMLRRIVTCQCDIKIKPPGDCTAPQFVMLENAVVKDCEKTLTGQDGIPDCTLGMTPNMLADLAKRFQKCLAARQKLEETCFRGGNRAHINWRIVLTGKMTYCQALLAFQNGFNGFISF